MSKKSCFTFFYWSFFGFLELFCWVDACLYYKHTITSIVCLYSCVHSCSSVFVCTNQAHIRPFILAWAIHSADVCACSESRAQTNTTCRWAQIWSYWGIMRFTFASWQICCITRMGWLSISCCDVSDTACDRRRILHFYLVSSLLVTFLFTRRCDLCGGCRDQNIIMEKKTVTALRIEDKTYGFVYMYSIKRH